MAASRYDGIVPRVVLGMKNAGRTDLVPLMGRPWLVAWYELLRAHRGSSFGIPRPVPPKRGPADSCPILTRERASTRLRPGLAPGP